MPSRSVSGHPNLSTQLFPNKNGQGSPVSAISSPSESRHPSKVSNVLELKFTVSVDVPP